MVMVTVVVIMTVTVTVVMAVIMTMTVVMGVIVVVIMIVAMIMVVIMPVVRHQRGSLRRSASSRRTITMAAPNPLSMFTTLTPDAQLVSIPKSAVKPPSAVP